MGFSDDRGKDFPAGMYSVAYDSSTKSMTVPDLPEFGIPSENQWIACEGAIHVHMLGVSVLQLDLKAVALRVHVRQVSVVYTVHVHVLTIANYVVEASVPTIILFCVIREDVDDLYKWQTFWPSGLHHRQISHAANLALMKATGPKRLPFI